MPACLLAYGLLNRSKYYLAAFHFGETASLRSGLLNRFAAAAKRFLKRKRKRK
jgi:hypothetical protein